MGVGREEDEPPYRHCVAACGTYRVEETFMEQWQQFQVMAPQLVPSRGTILLTVTSQGWENSLQ